MVNNIYVEISVCNGVPSVLDSHQKGPTHRTNFREWEQSKKGSATFKHVDRPSSSNSASSSKQPVQYTLDSAVDKAASIQNAEIRCTLKVVQGHLSFSLGFKWVVSLHGP